MNLSDLLAVFALVISFASVVYARASAKAAKAANKIGLHQPRKDIYDGLLHFRSLFVGMDLHPTDEEIDTFYAKSVAPARIYLQPELAKRIHSIYKKSWELFRLIEVAESGERPQMSKWDYIKPFQELGRTELEAVIGAVAEEIHVGRT
ncbi:hypothetical protein ACSBPQ_14485 [Stenotrophomonas sp. JC08]|uniref:hypothetical protein n=1 Tax=Stenotrophomonas sp. JC08 TaxID=3445779 RepID=UPI003FA34023